MIYADILISCSLAAVLEIYTQHFYTSSSFAQQYPYYVTIQFISHCVKETVFNILSEYITANNIDGVYITKDTL